MARRSLCSVLLLCLLAPVSSAFAQPTPRGLADFDGYVERVMRDWKVPGAAIAIVADGKVVLSKGYGLRDVKNHLPVTEHTLFPIASITKSFTVATLATLVREGKLDWDKPARDYLADFRLYNADLTEHVTTRDLVTHRTGLPRHDGTWYRTDLTRQELYDRLRYLEPSRDLRQEFQYNNLMFMTAGYLAGRLTGGSWEDAVQRRIFDPLGMHQSSFDLGAAMQASTDVAHAYRKDDAEVVHEVPVLAEDRVIGPAGGIVSNLTDMTQYLLMYLDQGRRGDQQIIAPADVRSMMTPQMIIHTSALDPEYGALNYGMGLFVTTYRGHTLVHHGGNLDGFSLLLTMLPDDHIGAVILLDMESSALREVLAASIADRLLGLSPIDWSKRELDRYLAFRDADKQARDKNYVPRQLHTSFAHAIDDYVGEYSHPAYGTIVIARAAGDSDLTITYHTMHSTAQHWHYDVWRVPHDPLDLLQETEIMFNTGWDGNIASLSSSLEPAVKDIIFQRQPDRRMHDIAFLTPLAGTYRVADFKLVVTLRADSTLVLTLPDQTVYTLDPVRGSSFAMRGENGMTADFKHNSAGSVTELSLNQAGSSTVFARAP